MISYLYSGGITGIAAHVGNVLHNIDNCFNYGKVTIEAPTEKMYVGAISGKINNIGLTYTNVCSVNDVCANLIGYADYEPTGNNYEFNSKAEIDKQAAYINKYFSESHQSLMKYLLDLDISGLETVVTTEITTETITTEDPSITTTDDVTTTTADVTTEKPIVTTTEKPDETTTKKPEVTTAAPSTNTPETGGCGAITGALSAIIIFISAVPVILIKKAKH